MTLLSICIPTFNRKSCLEHLLKTLAPQLTEEVEVIISDNCSTDGTSRWIEGFLSHSKQVYYRFSSQVPCGDNLLKSVDLASSSFCWLMSDDDAFEGGAISFILEILKKEPNISGISVNVQGYDRMMTYKKNIHYSHSLIKTEVFTEKEKAFSELGAWMGFWSAQIVKKKLWQEALKDQRYKDYEGYFHLFLITSILSKNPLWLFISDKLVHYRADHESFTREYGRVYRFFIDVKAYKEIPSLFFSKKAQKRVQQQVIKKLLFWQLIRAKCEGLKVENCIKIYFIGFKYFKNHLSFWALLTPLLLCPQRILLAARYFYRRKKNEAFDCNSNI